MIVRKMTGATVDRYNIAERGYLKPGYKADLTILDLDHIKVNEAKPDFRPEGIVHVYVNGKPVMKNTEYLGTKAGEVILRKDYE